MNGQIFSGDWARFLDFSNARERLRPTVVVRAPLPGHEVHMEGYAGRRGAQRDAGADERFVANAWGARTDLVSDH
jgi:hypothetical protein